MLSTVRVRRWSDLDEVGTLASAKRLAAAGSWREALDGMLGCLMDDRDEATAAMRDVFAVLGDDDPLVPEFRPQALERALLARRGTMADVHDQIRDFWDRDAHTYDDSASHAISDPLEAAAWRAALLRALPERGAKVLDAGAGTGALSLLAAELGYVVTALDLSEGMLSKARAKAEANGVGLTFVVGPAAEPPPGPVRRHHGTARRLDHARPRDGAPRVAGRHGAGWTTRLVRRPLGRRHARRRWRRTVPPRRCGRSSASHDHHHAPYPEDVLAQLPLAEMPSPTPLIEMVREAGWTGCASSACATSNGPRCGTIPGRWGGWRRGPATR